MAEIADEQVLAFRVAGHHLGRRTDALTAIGACGIQQSPPGWAEVALRARTNEDPDPGRVVMVNAMRGAPYLVPRADVAVFTRSLMPAEEDLRAIINSRETKEAREAGYTPREALDAVAAAAREALADGPLGRDDFHQALRERLPDDLLPWCANCASHHVRPGFWRTLGPLGVTTMPERATWELAEPVEFDLDRVRAELARRFLRCYGPGNHTELARWAQTAPKHAKALFELIADELDQVETRAGRRWILAADRKCLERPPKASGVRMLGGFDPYVSQPDRETLVGDAKLRKRMFPAVGRPGVILDHGRLAGLWRGRKSGETLAIELEWLGDPVELGREPAVVATARGCEDHDLVEV